MSEDAEVVLTGEKLFGRLSCGEATEAVSMNHAGAKSSELKLATQRQPGAQRFNVVVAEDRP